MAVRTAAVAERAVATTFEVPGSSSVPGDGTRRRIKVTQVDLPVEYVHVAVPRLEEAAFLVAEGEWTAAWPLLAGQVGIFLDDAFVGNQALPTVGTGGEIEIGFGRDDAVRVEKVVVQDLTSQADWMGMVTYRGSWTYEVESSRKEAVKLELLDRLPVSKEVRYTVKATGDEPDETTPEGICTFVRTLSPGQESAVTFGYVVRWPRRSPPGGLP
jgi:uncharacterized protein (TIGR02231 family)